MAVGRELKTILTADTADYERKMHDAAQEVDRFADEVARAGRTARTSLDRDVGEGFDDAGDTAREAGQEIGAEFAENIGEGFRSGDAVGVLTESLTSLTNAAFGMGKGALIFGALGLGAVGSVINAFRERQDELDSAARSAAESMAASFDDGFTGRDLRSALIEAVQGVDEDALTVIGDAAAAAGSSIDEFFAVIAAGGETEAKYVDKLVDRLAELRNGEQTAAAVEEAKAIRTLLNRWRDYSGVAGDAVKAAKYLKDAQDGNKGSADDAAAAIDKARKSSERAARAARRHARAMEAEREAAERLADAIALMDSSMFSASLADNTAYRGAFRDVFTQRPRGHNRTGRRGQ